MRGFRLFLLSLGVLLAQRSQGLEVHGEYQNRAGYAYRATVPDGLVAHCLRTTRRPMPASPLMTEFGTKSPITPNRRAPKTTWSAPASSTATRNPSIRWLGWPRAMPRRPRPGPLTLNGDRKAHPPLFHDHSGDQAGEDRRAARSGHAQSITEVRRERPQSPRPRSFRVRPPVGSALRFGRAHDLLPLSAVERRYFTSILPAASTATLTSDFP